MNNTTQERQARTRAMRARFLFERRADARLIESRIVARETLQAKAKARMDRVFGSLS